jgi:hypothetical protein
MEESSAIVDTTPQLRLQTLAMPAILGMEAQVMVQAQVRETAVFALMGNTMLLLRLQPRV